MISGSKPRHALTLGEASALLAAGVLRSQDLTESCLERIEADNPRFNAFITVTADLARAGARAADEAHRQHRSLGLLHGLPISLKDLFDLEGTPTTAASRVRSGATASTTAPTAARLIAQGAVIVGKTNLHEFAFGTTSEDSGFGRIGHPLDHRRSPGGSSGGSACAVARGMGLASLGTDTGGSVRIPSALCGLVGLKPTIGELDTAGVVPLSRSFDHVGPLARTVRDAWLLFDALRGATASEALTAPPGSVRGLRVGVLRNYFCDLLDASVRRSFERAVDGLAAGGADLRPVSLPHASDIAHVYLLIVLAEAAACHRHTLDTCPELYTAPVRERLEMGRYVLAEDYVRAVDGRGAIRQEVDRALDGLDVLVAPTVPIPAPMSGTAVVDFDGRTLPLRSAMLRLTQPFNVSGHPAITVPGAPSSDYLPIGIQIVGHHHRTHDLLRHALAMEPVLA